MLKIRERIQTRKKFFSTFHNIGLCKTLRIFQTSGKFSSTFTIAISTWKNNLEWVVKSDKIVKKKSEKIASTLNENLTYDYYEANFEMMEN